MDGRNAIVKATYGVVTRKWKTRSHGKHSDLVNEVIDEFGIDAKKIHLKYKDSDGDLIDLLSDDDLELAVELEKSLNLVVINDSDDLPASLIEFRSALTTLIADATRLFSSLDTLSLPEKKCNLVSTRDAVSSPVKSEPIATIDPSVLEEVHLNDTSNGTVHESKPPAYDNNGIQSFPIKSSQFDSPLGYSQQQNLPPSHVQPLSNSQQQSHGQQQSHTQPPSNHSQPPVSMSLPPQQGLYSNQSAPLPPPVSNYGQQTAPNVYGSQQSQVQPNSAYDQQAPPSFNQVSQAPPSFNQGQQNPLNSAKPPSMIPSQYGSNQSSQPPILPPVQQAPMSNQPPVSNYGSQSQQFPTQASAYGQHPASNYNPSQQAPPSIYGQTPPVSNQQAPPSSFNPAGQQNPFQRPPSSMPMPPTSYGQQQQNY